MSLGNKVWRIVTQTYQSTETGKEEVHTELVGPGYYTRMDKNVTERLAVPKPIHGPFTFHNNGYGTIQLMDGDQRMVCAVSFGKGFARMCDKPEQFVAEEEALWLAKTIVDTLNKS